MLYLGRDDEFRPVSPLQLLNQMLRNLGLAGRKGGESSREGEECYLLSLAFTS